MIKIKNWKMSVATLTLTLAIGLLCGGLVWAAKPPPPPPPPPSPSPVPYSIELLGTLGGPRSWAFGINNQAAVVGWAETENGEAAFLSYVNSQGVREMVNLNELPDPVELLSGWDLRFARDINDNFQIVGQGHFLGEQRGWRLTLVEYEGRLTVESIDDLGTLDPLGPGSLATGISELGHVTGDWLTAGNVHHGYLWTQVEEMGEMRDLGSLPGAISAHTNAINNLDEIVGYAPSPARAVRFTPAEGTFNAQYLGVIKSGRGGIAESWANDINDDGVVVGKSTAGISKLSTIYRAFRYTDETGMVALGTLGGQNSWAQGINSQGEIVGRAETAAGDSAVFLHYTDAKNITGMVNVTASIRELPTDFSPNLPITYSFYKELRINDYHLICGTGLNSIGKARAFLLTPVSPAP